jgi:hypothetical protein
MFHNDFGIVLTGPAVHPLPQLSSVTVWITSPVSYTVTLTNMALIRCRNVRIREENEFRK